MTKFNPLRALLSGFLAKGFPKTSGSIDGIPVRGHVEVLRDPWGIPHIYAGSARDLFVAQGFVHAQDRLWQMESMRRLVTGRLSEVAGGELLHLDCLTRILGLAAMRGNAFKDASDAEREMLQAYAEGVNALIDRQDRDLPLEFRSMHFRPEPWQPEDCLSFSAIVCWQMLLIPYFQGLLALVKRRELDLEVWDDMFPSHPGDVLPPEDFFASFGRLRFGDVHPAAFAFHDGLKGKNSAAALKEQLRALAVPGAGSNNWVVAEGRDGKPMLANDPHLGVALPATWYFCYLECPASPHFPRGLHLAGASVAGCPGVVIGRNEHVAWGVTNVMLDAADVLVLRVDPSAPTCYQIEGRSLEMEREEVVLRPRGAPVLRLPIYRTIFGPALTVVEKGVEAVAVLKWYGSLRRDALADHSIRGSLSMWTAETAAQALDAGRHWKWLAMNLVACDDAGHIGWHATGAAPVRRGYSGRLPASGTAGADWTGFLAYNDLPHSFDPPEGFLATANHKTTPVGAQFPLSHRWCAPYRYARITECLRGMRRPGPEDFMKVQMDVHSLQADRIVPQILAFPLQSAKARAAAGILSQWDREVRADSLGAAVYEVFLARLERIVFKDLLGEDFALYTNSKIGSHMEDFILGTPRSPLWRNLPPAADVVEKALVGTVETLEIELGTEPRRWRWGRLHRYVPRHPGARNAILAWMLNPAPRPAGGDCATVNVAWTLSSRGNFDVRTIPSLRMIVPIDDLDGMRIIGPLGQSGQPGHRHYDDMFGPWARGEYVRLAWTRKAVEEAVTRRLVLEP